MISPILSSTSITGTNVTNSKGENLGEIKDLMIDTQNGTVNYAVLSYGGFLGMGDKLFAVPFEAFSVNETTETFILDVDKEVLKSAPGFDKNDWPKTSDTSFWNGLYSHYGVTRRPFIHESSLTH